MKTITKAILIGILMTPIMLFAAPHEPSPAGGGWLELNPKLGQVQTDAPWFPELTGTLTIEAWIYVDEPLSKQVIFSLLGQTDRFDCFLIGTPVDEDEDGVLDTEPGILSQGTTEHSGTMMGNLPVRQWVHYVATINRGAAVGSDGYIAEGVDGSELPIPNENRLVLGGTPVISGIPMMPGFKARFASGIYIDELRISSSIRYKGNYGVPTQVFTADADTIGLYHFDTESNQPYEDSSNSQIPLIRSEIDPEVLAEIEEATASPVLSKSEEELLQLISEGITYYDSLLKSGRVDFLRETTSVASDRLPGMGRAPSGTWKGTFEFSGRKMRCVVTRDAIQYEPDRNIPITGTKQYAYDGETFETLRETFNGIMLSRRSEIVDNPSDDPRFWGWNLSGREKSLVMLIDELDVESIKEVRFNDSDVYHVKGNMFGVAIELWLNPKKSYRPERYVFANPMIAITSDYKFKEVAPDLWFPASAKAVKTVIDMNTGAKTDVKTTTVQFTNIRINEPIPESRFSIEPPPGARGYDMRTRESFEVPVSD